MVWSGNPREFSDACFPGLSSVWPSHRFHSGRPGKIGSFAGPNQAASPQLSWQSFLLLPIMLIPSGTAVRFILSTEEGFALLTRRQGVFE